MLECNSNQKVKLHICSENNYLDGWININNNPDNKSDFHWDFTTPLNFKENCIDFIYSNNSNNFGEGLMHFNKILKQGGVLRISANNIDKEEFKSKIKDAGFSDIDFCNPQESIHKEFDKLMNEEAGLIAEVTKTNKVPCYILIFFDFDIIKKSIDFITKYSDKLDINIVENYSDYTESQIKPYILDLVRQRKVNNYYLFDENIGANALTTIVRFDKEYIKNYPYFMATDGDLLPDNKDWLDEEINIMDNNPEVFAVGTELDLSNLPLKLHPESINWVEKSRIIEGKNYVEGPTGGWFTLYRTEPFFQVTAWLDNAGERWIDFNLLKYAYLALRLKWARTKKSLAKHLTWDSYADPEHPYIKWRSKFTNDELWKHDKHCGFTLFNKIGAKHYANETHCIKV